MESRKKSRKIPYFDAHCDTLTLAADTSRDLFDTPEPYFDTSKTQEKTDSRASSDTSKSLDSLSEPPFALQLGKENYSPRAQVFAIYGDSALKDFDPGKRFHSAYSHFQRQLSKFPDKLIFCKSPQDLEKSRTGKKIAALLAIEGAEVLSCSEEKLEHARSCGVCITGITWNHANILSGSCVEREDEGLTSRGIRFVDKAVSLGMLVDVSHLSPRGTDEVIERCKGKAFASHSNSRSVRLHNRNLTDAQFISLVNSGSLCCISLYTPFLSEYTASVDNAVDHILYLAGLAPDGIKHIGIGADFDGCNLLPQGLENSCKVELLYSALIRRGLTTADTNNILYYNMYKYFKSNMAL